MTVKRLFFLICLVTAIALYVALPSEYDLNVSLLGKTVEKKLVKIPLDVTLFGRRIFFNPEVKLGLDLQGGTHLLMEAKMDEIAKEDREDALVAAREVIARRVDLFGVSEPLIQTSKDSENEVYRIIIELPGIKDTQQAIDLIGQTAQLEFREQNQELIEDVATPSAMDMLSSFVPTELTGKELKKASVQFDQQNSQPVVALEFTDEGARLFEEITDRNVGNVVGIFLDGVPVTLPRVQQKITNGEAVISGSFTTESAKQLSIQLNAGALPVPIEVISQTTVGATLGEGSVQKSMIAGGVGLLMVMTFMVFYYGYLGFLADLALVVYGIFTLALYKILGVTLTLPGLAGFILSVGMAVDSNILIFERMKEELRIGKHWKTAVELGFGRAWDSIKDANIATLTICFILFNPFSWQFLNTSGMVRGFALTLALGIMISLFTGIVVTRTFIRLFYQGKDKK